MRDAARAFQLKEKRGGARGSPAGAGRRRSFRLTAGRETA
jgi:hypothetical protein